MKSEKLNKKITIQQIGTAKDSFGQMVETWVDVQTVYASIEPLTGKEFFAAKQIHSELTTTIKIRYLAGVDTSKRVKYGDRIFDILAIIDPNERHVELYLMCKEVI